MAFITTIFLWTLGLVAFLALAVVGGVLYQAHRVTRPDLPNQVPKSKSKHDGRKKKEAGVYDVIVIGG